MSQMCFLPTVGDLLQNICHHHDPYLGEPVLHFLGPSCLGHLCWCHPLLWGTKGTIIVQCTCPGHVHWTIMVLPILIVTPQAKEWLMIHFQIVRAHRLLLSACSPYFRRLLSGLTSCQHPIIILRWSPSQGNADASNLFQRRKSFRLGGDLGVYLQWGSEHRARVFARLPGSRWDSPHSGPHRGG